MLWHNITSLAFFKAKSSISPSDKKKIIDEAKCLSKSSYLTIFGKILVGSLCLLVIVGLAFYYLPWENYLFSESELNRLLNDNSDYGIQDFLATVDQHFEEVGMHEVECMKRAYYREKRLNAAPRRCGTIITDDFLPQNQVDALRNLAIKVINIAGDTSYANRESINLQWINLHNLFRRNNTRKFLTKRDYQLIVNASIAAKETVAFAFGIPEESLHYNLVCQFTRYRPLVKFSEFRHVDKVRSPALVVTSILWLSTHNLDFGGGLLEFLTGPGPEPFSPVIVEPKKGRFAAWTSGFENPHGVGEVYWGNRLALIFAFTVSPKLGYKTIDALREWSLSNITSGPNSGY